MTWAIKIAGSILVVFATASYGIMLSSDLKKRLYELKELKKVFFLLKGEIRFGRTPLFEAMDNVSRRCTKPFSDIFRTIASEGRKEKNIAFYDIWEKVLEDKLTGTHLNGNEKDRLLETGKSFALQDYETVQNAIDSYQMEIENDISQLEKSVPKKTRVYNTMGIMCGIVITLIIV